VHKCDNKYDDNNNYICINTLYKGDNDDDNNNNNNNNTGLTICTMAIKGCHSPLNHLFLSD